MNNDRIMVPWAIYDPKGNIAWLGLEATRMFAWAAYKTLSYGEIIRRESEGWTVKRVEVHPLNPVVGLRRNGPVPTHEIGEFSKDII